MTQAVKSKRSVNILIAEDSRFQADMLASMLEQYGYTVTIAADGKRALEAVKARAPNLVISDIVMPEMDGYELCRRIKSSDEMKDIPVILVTTLSDPSDVIRGLECGADNFIHKPISEEYLLSRINYLLMNHELRGVQKLQFGMEIKLGDKKFFIDAERQQILDLLISTYEQAMHINNDLKHREQELTSSNRIIQGLYNISGELNHAVTEKAVAEIVLKRLSGLPGIKAGWISVWHGGGEHEIVEARDLPPGFPVSAIEEGCSKCKRKLNGEEREGVASYAKCEDVTVSNGGAQKRHYHVCVSSPIEGGKSFCIMHLLGTGDGQLSKEKIKMLCCVGQQLSTAMERARLYGTLERERLKAERASRAKSSFLATMSHEIRTPLTGMLGMLELLSFTDLDNEQRVTLDTAWESARGLLRIVSDILDWSKIEEGKLELLPSPTSIGQLLQEVVNTYSRVASANGLKLWQHTGDNLAQPYVVDPLRLSQVLNNFVSNALKFTRQGEVMLGAELVDRLGDRDRIRFFVNDTGIGISEEEQKHLFRLYQQGSAQTERMYGGTGLGLAICRRLSDMMDGQIDVRSEPGVGSTFSITLTLPISDEPAQALRMEQPAVKQRAVPPLFREAEHAPVILIVDDHPTNRDLFGRQARLLGLRVETAEHGRDALSKLKQQDFSLVITDCHMPEMDGYQLARQIRKLEAGGHHHLPVIACTANAVAEEGEHCRQAGMDDLLVKPVSMEQLRKVLAKWLPGAASATGQHEVGKSRMTARRTASPVDYSELEKIVPDHAEQLEVLNEFQSHIHVDHALLAKLLEQGDPLDIERAAHRMKGSCRMVGARKLAEICESVERYGRDGDIERARKAGADMAHALRLLEEHLAGAGY